MCTALFFITHNGIASNLIAVAESILRQKAVNIDYYEVSMDDSILDSIKEIDSKLAKLDCTSIIFITDIFGSTPSNIAHQVAEKHQAHLISGVNLPMVIRLLNYRDAGEEDLIEKAVEGAQKGILQAR
jgi:PTS system mannose-specific IIA component